jgi:hypothetical protein
MDRRGETVGRQPIVLLSRSHTSNSGSCDKAEDLRFIFPRTTDDTFHLEKLSLRHIHRQTFETLQSPTPSPKVPQESSMETSTFWSILCVVLVIGFFLYDLSTKRIPSRNDPSQAPRFSSGLHRADPFQTDVTADGVE